MSMTVSTRIEHRPLQRAAGQRRHDMREGVIPKYVDQSRISQNSVIIAPLTEYKLKAICEERRGKRDTKRAAKSTAAVGTHGIITFGHEAQSVIELLPVAEQDALYLKAAQTIADRLDTDLTGLVVHRDESAPHGHYQLPAVDRSGKPLSKVITPSVAKELQDIVGAVYGELGIKRGKEKVQRIRDGEPAHTWTHRTVGQLHKDLPAELEAAIQKVEKAQRLADTARAKVAELVAEGKEKSEEIRKAQKRLATYEAREAKAARALGGMPEIKTMTRVMGRTPRLFGLLPDKVETATVRVIPSIDLDAAVIAKGEALDRRESRLVSRERALKDDQETLCRERQALAVERQEVEQIRAEAFEAYERASELARAARLEKPAEQTLDAGVGSLRAQAPEQAHTRTRSRDSGLSR